MQQPRHDATGETASSGPHEQPRRALAFALSNGRWAIPLDAVSAIARCERLCPVPGAPSPVLGLAQVRASPVAVLDCARLLRGRQLAGEPSLIVLAPPHERTALFVASRIELTQIAAGATAAAFTPRDTSRANSSIASSGRADRARAFPSEEPATLIDAAALLKVVEERLRGL